MLVTGAGGYIGSVLVRMLLQEGHEVVAVDRFLFGREVLPDQAHGLTVLQEDIRRLQSEVLESVDAVVDLAALSNDPSGELDPERTWEVNHRARVRLARISKDTGVRRYILPSSCSVYGFQQGWLDESSSVSPLTTYAKANLQAERDVLPLASADFCVVVIRQATVYGYSPRMRFDLAINGMVRGFFRNGRIPILRDGTQWRPFVHVRDTCRAMLLLLEAPRELVNGEIFNVGSDDQNVQILPLARRVAEAIGVPFQYEWYGLPDHRSYRVSFRKITERLGYRTTQTVEDGVREVYQALKEGHVDPDDPRTITVSWYKHLIEKGVPL
ncbi:MAG: SDR family oxidoreductase [Armatimonadota bacterium]|nr:SDR family oxidoreductase [Armatimonadota bacterium]MDR7565834.1 SDR family oxidoreductase [Armatimonadota bacterium]MDR7607001.1 SDR family oxidoreductase [Armatimonadota bacterium]